MSMSIWNLIEQYVDDTGATEASIQRRAGLNKGTFSAWRARGVPRLPTHKDVLGLAFALKAEYDTVLTALLHDARYLPQSEAHAAAHDELEMLRFRRARVDFVWTEASGDKDVAQKIARGLKPRNEWQKKALFGLALHFGDQVEDPSADIRAEIARLEEWERNTNAPRVEPGEYTLAAAGEDIDDPTVEREQDEDSP